MDYFQKLMVDIELHSVAGIRECFENGLNPNDFFRGEPLIYELISEYNRTPRFKDCVKAFVDYGLLFNHEALLAVLLDDAQALTTCLKKNPRAIETKYSMRSAYTPLHGVTLLHICSEFNHLSCARILIENGANVNAMAGLDGNRLGGQTPIFHAVNQPFNNSLPVLEYLLTQSVDLGLTIPGLLWGKDHDWETFIPAVNPISYTMMGLLPQMHRDEKSINEVISLLMKAAYGIDFITSNLPNQYLRKCLFWAPFAQMTLSPKQFSTK